MIWFYVRSVFPVTTHSHLLQLGLFTDGVMGVEDVKEYVKKIVDRFEK